MFYPFVSKVKVVDCSIDQMRGEVIQPMKMVLKLKWMCREADMVRGKGVFNHHDQDTNPEPQATAMLHQ